MEAVPLQLSTTVICWSAHVLLLNVFTPDLDLPNGVHVGLDKFSVDNNVPAILFGTTP
jgi:hypothetical protein